jgi:LPS sulfotransferase NodH
MRSLCPLSILMMISRDEKKTSLAVRTVEYCFLTRYTKLAKKESYIKAVD